MSKSYYEVTIEHRTIKSVRVPMDEVESEEQAEEWAHESFWTSMGFEDIRQDTLRVEVIEGEDFDFR
jgi:hypothetical protein